MPGMTRAPLPVTILKPRLSATPDRDDHLAGLARADRAGDAADFTDHGPEPLLFAPRGARTHKLARHLPLPQHDNAPLRCRCKARKTGLPARAGGSVRPCMSLRGTT